MIEMVQMTPVSQSHLLLEQITHISQRKNLTKETLLDLIRLYVL